MLDEIGSFPSHDIIMVIVIIMAGYGLALAVYERLHKK